MSTPSRNDRFADDFDYEAFEDQFDPLNSDRQARRKRKPRVNPKTAQQDQAEVVDELVDEEAGLEAGFEITYQPSKHEAGWLLESLRSLYDQEFITDVLAQVKGGKEASVYRCAGHASTGQEFLAAKVYRPRMFRQLRNDHTYRQGRNVIMGDGTAINESDFREMRAIAKGTSFGKKLQHTSWLMHEFDVLKRLHSQGAPVPQPVAVGDNVILMSYHGDEHMAAPTLNTIRLEREEARPLFNDVMRTVEQLMAHGWVHGDLSAYNILYWAGEIVVIDFPQVTNIESNRQAFDILRRDLARVADYFRGQGLRVDSERLALHLWRKYAGATPLELAEAEAPFAEADEIEAMEAAKAARDAWDE